ncbi:MAG TPA: hypothetical protein VFV77_07620 [Gammaproteobacteria bacterium]|nr:hypothetical protein [Gammaproteobacteria bacterium]
MQPERQISLFCVMAGGALVYPEVRMLLQHAEEVPGGQLMTGGFFGAGAVFFGTLLTLDAGPRWFKALSLGFWGLVALAFAAAMQFGASRSPGPVRMGLFEFFTALVLVAFFGTLYGNWWVERRARRTS